MGGIPPLGADCGHHCGVKDSYVGHCPCPECHADPLAMGEESYPAPIRAPRLAIQAGSAGRSVDRRPVSQDSLSLSVRQQEDGIEPGLE